MRTPIRILAIVAALTAVPAVLLAQETPTQGSGTAAGAATTAAPNATQHWHRHHRDLFKKWDTNGDGQITRDEAQAAAAAMATKRFDKLDLNHDGVLTREEVQQALQARRAQRHQQSPSSATPAQ